MRSSISFSNLEKKSMHEMRNKLNHAEDKIDLENQFSYTVVNFLRKIFEKKNLDILFDDIVFTPDKKNNYLIKKKLKNSYEFKTIWNNSDLSNVIKRFADTTYHKYIHMDRHSIKSEQKLRN